MNDYISLGIAVGSVVVSTGLVVYIRGLKRRIRRHVLRHDEIEKYFEGEEQ